MMFQDRWEQVEVDLESVINHIARKLHSDIEDLKDLFNHGDGIHNFREQTRLLKEVQAGVRATHVLDGSVDLKGNTLEPPALTRQPLSTERVDLNELELTITGARAADDGSAPVSDRNTASAVAALTSAKTHAA
jgi:hypothetical protein